MMLSDNGNFHRKRYTIPGKNVYEKRKAEVPSRNLRLPFHKEEKGVIVVYNIVARRQ
jgi:hypothetical protein